MQRSFLLVSFCIFLLATTAMAEDKRALVRYNVHYDCQTRRVTMTFPDLQIIERGDLEYYEATDKSRRVRITCRSRICKEVIQQVQRLSGVTAPRLNPENFFELSFVLPDAEEFEEVFPTVADRVRLAGEASGLVAKYSPKPFLAAKKISCPPPPTPTPSPTPPSAPTPTPNPTPSQHRDVPDRGEVYSPDLGRLISTRRFLVDLRPGDGMKTRKTERMRAFVFDLQDFLGQVRDTFGQPLFVLKGTQGVYGPGTISAVNKYRAMVGLGPGDWTADVRAKANANAHLR